MTRHLTAEEISVLVERSLDRERATPFLAHLAGCPGCAAAYADAVRARADWLRRRESFALPAEVTAGLARDSGPDAAPARRPRPVRRWVPLAASAAVLIACASAALLIYRSAPPTALDLPPAVRASVESSSARELVLPGGERHADRAAQEMRTGASSSPPELTREVDQLTSRYEAGDRSADAAAKLVAALLASGDLAAANAYAREALRGYPRDVRLLVLTADLHYRNSELDAAERMLRDALQIAPHEPLLQLDLALVLRERGDTSQSRDGFEHVAASGSRPLAERARHELRR